MSFKTRLLAAYQSKDSGASPRLSLFNQYNVSRYPYLLSSSAVRQNNAQYDILFACPQYELRLDSDRSLHCTNKDLDISAGFFDTLEKLYQQNKVEASRIEASDNQEDLPFTGVC